MKVLHVIPSLGPLRGGPSMALPQMARGLVKAGVEVHIATTNDNGVGILDAPLETPIINQDVTTYYFNRQFSTYTISFPLKRWLQQHVQDYDLLHIHSLFSYSSTVAGACARRAKVPYIVRTLGHLNHWGMTKRHGVAKQLSMRLVENRLLNNAALIHYTSEQEQQQAEQNGICVPSCVLPLGIKLGGLRQKENGETLIEKYPQLTGRFIFLFLARLHEIKGLDLLLPAFAELHHQYPQVALVLAGDGDETMLQKLHALVNELGLQETVTFTGFLKDDDKKVALNGASAFILPSYYESFANAVVEAMAVGLPVIVSDQVGVANAVQHANAGLVVSCSVRELKDAMSRLLLNPDLCLELGSNGKKLVQEKFSIEAATDALVDVYQQILASGKNTD
jgi:glycosyltransferase involved in cell wall biosynthesis